MRFALVVLGSAACLAVAIRTVSIRGQVVRAGYVRAVLEREIAEEREVVQCLRASIAAATAPRALHATAERLGIEMVERAPRQIVRARAPEYAEAPRRHLARR